MERIQRGAGWPRPKTPEQQNLVARIRCGDLDGARSFVENLTAESRRKITKDSSLMLAALQENRPEFIRFLVKECSAELEKSVMKPVWNMDVGDDSITPLRYAVRFGKIIAAVELMRLGADVNAVSPNSGLTALHNACKNGVVVIVRHLIQHGADLTISDDHGKTALMYAIDYADVCRELIISGADVNAVDDDGDTALHYAIDDGHKNPEVVKLLLENGADLFQKNNDGYDAHYMACRDQAIDIVKVMRDQFSGDEGGQKALIESHQLLGACYIDYHDPFSRYSHIDKALAEWETVIRLREEMRHVICGEDDVVLPTHSAYANTVEVDSMMKFDEMRQDVKKICMQGLLLKEKILGPTHFETINSVSHSATFYITSEDYGQCLRLLRHGFKVSRDSRMDSLTKKFPLDILWDRSKRQIGVFNKRAISNTLDFRDVYEFLETITDETRRSVHPTAEDSSLLAVSEIFLQITLNLVKLFFFLEANKINTARFRRLVQDFVRLNLRSSRGRTILMKAIFHQNYSWFFCDVDVIKLLLECGADTWETDKCGNSVLHLLAKSEKWIFRKTGNVPNKEANKKAAEMLLEFGAHFDARNNEGFSAVDYLSSLGLEFSTHMTLQCLAAQAIRRHKIPYVGILPKSLVDFVQMH